MRTKRDIAALVLLTQDKIALVSPEDYRRVIQFNWAAAFINGHWYALRAQLPRGMHSFLTGRAMTDHINNNGLDNTRSNLQETNHRHNAARSKLPSSNTSGHRGVRKFKTRWRAALSSNIYVGQFGTREEAIEAYHKAFLERHGEPPTDCGCQEVI
jgi:hypothetical protein